MISLKGIHELPSVGSIDEKVNNPEASGRACKYKLLLLENIKFGGVIFSILRSFPISLNIFFG